MSFCGTKEDLLIDAVVNKDLESVKDLLEENNKISNKKIGKAIEKATINNSVDIVEYLIKKSLSKERNSNLGFDNAFYIASSKNYSKIIEIFLKEAKNQITNKCYEKSFEKAAKNQGMDAFKLILGQAVEKISDDKIGNVLRNASYTGNNQVVVYILVNAKEKVSTEKIGQALIDASNRANIVNTILIEGKDKLSSYHVGITLNNAASYGNEEVVTILLKDASDKLSYSQIRTAYSSAAQVAGLGLVTERLVKILRDAMERAKTQNVQLEGKSVNKKDNLDEQNEVQRIRNKMLMSNNKLNKEQVFGL